MKPPRWASRVADRMDDADTLKAFHKWATIWWATFGLGLSILWMDFIPWVVFMSLWANVAAHWGAWQATRAEVQEKNARGDSGP